MATWAGMKNGLTLLFFFSGKDELTKCQKKERRTGVVEDGPVFDYPNGAACSDVIFKKVAVKNNCHSTGFPLIST